MRLLSILLVASTPLFFASHVEAKQNESGIEAIIDAQLIPDETITVSSGVRIATYLDPQRKTTVGILSSGERLVGEEVSKFGQSNKATSDSYTRTRKVRSVECGGCIEETVATYRGDYRSAVVVKRGGEVFERMTFGQGNLAGFPLSQSNGDNKASWSYRFTSEGVLSGIEVEAQNVQHPEHVTTVTQECNQN
jgi:hypothetical protein